MNRSLQYFFVLALSGLAFTSCAPTMSITTENSAGASLDRGALHYVIPPLASDPADMQNLYPLVVAAFKQNHIALTSSRKAAVYTVTWGSEQKLTQVKSLQGSGYSSGQWGTLNANSGDAWGNPTYGQSATGPEFAHVMRTVKMHNFMVTVWKKEGAENAQPVVVWTGHAEIGSHDAEDAAVIIDQIVARYGTDFEGQAQVK